MTPIAPGGFLLVLEGIDGTGKTTLASSLAQFCGEHGIACTFSREPTGLRFGRQLRQSGESGRLSADDELELFLKDRANHVARAIQPTLDFGGVVILDRYYWSTAAYQGARGIDSAGIIARNEAIAPRPDLVILLDAEPSASLERVRSRGDAPNHFEHARALQLARQIFLDLHASPAVGPSTMIDASQPLATVHAQARNTFLQALTTTITSRHPTPETALQLLED